ncbi:hypothetical protein SAMN05660462_02591 [Proteiniborus ethanoligenes]|uniref:Uncharacterized protein n=1 Tax=Proteiniborus ethanoligenes TaxID=415015 RepID=A0A1H3RY82_9FIRM|nr:hypothetical protein [Proteiniborus ethanoligenes]SDZ29829.1 hypothetical protein SAMN05660462_02591 [Proteiniborus ethanoligenes]
MNILQDLLLVNKSTINKTSKLFLKNWVIVFTGFVYTLLNIGLMIVMSLLFTLPILRFFSGIISFIATSAMISNYLYLLNQIIRYGRVTIQDFKEGFRVYLWKIYGVLFIGWAASFLFDRIIGPIIFSMSGALAVNIGFIISLLVLILMNALPESIYQKHYSSWDTVLYAFEFVKENWIEWFVPNVIMLGLFYIVTGNVIKDVFAISSGFLYSISIKGILLYIAGQIMFSFIMIYRGILFDILSTSTRRKRAYMQHLYK